MSRPSFLERPHDSLRAPRTSNYSPIDDAAACSKLIALAVGALLAVAALGAIVLTFADPYLPL